MTAAWIRSGDVRRWKWVSNRYSATVVSRCTSHSDTNRDDPDEAGMAAVPIVESLGRYNTVADQGAVSVTATSTRRPRRTPEPRATGMPLGLLPGATYDDGEVVVAPGNSLLVRPLAAFEVASTPGGEHEVRRRLQEVLDDARAVLPADRRAALETAVAEASMNAIEHGNQSRAELPVEIEVRLEVRLEGDTLVVAVTDQGRGGPMPTEVEEPDIEAKLRGEQSPRGWGLFLMRNMVDDLQVLTREGKHTVELRMRTGATR